MAELTSPRVSVVFTELAASAAARGEKGTVALIVRDESGVPPAALSQAAQTPEKLSQENQDYIRRAFLGYTAPPQRVLVCAMGGEDGLDAALEYMAAQTFDYLCGPADCTTEEAEQIAAWVKAQRRDNGAKFKAVLPNCAADDCAVVNFTGSGMTDGTSVWTTAEYCSRIAGLLAGTPMTISATYAPLPELSDCARLTREESDAAVGAGRLALKWDGRRVKLDRAVTSLTTTGDGVQDSFKKIKLVEVMDLIRTDITAAAEDGYVGRYANSYDNKLLLVAAVRGYLMGLAQEGLVQPGYTVDLDLEAQERYLAGLGMDTDGLSGQALREADTGSHVFLKVACKLLDAIEDIDVAVTI